MSPRSPLRGLALALGAALLGLTAAAPASALSLSGLSVTLDAANSANQFVDTNPPPVSRVRESALSVLSSSATSFSTRYALVVGTDIGVNPTITESHTASYTITFQVNANAGEAWSVLLDLSRVGALTLVNDSNGSASATLGAMTGSVSGGSLSGSLGLAAVGTLTRGNGGNQAFNQTGTAAINGVGTGAAQTVTLNFTWTASTTSTKGPGANGAGDEVAIRMGIDSALSQFTADNYPGTGNRTLTSDGQFISATLVPEPTSMLMMLAGLVGLALFGRRAAE